MAKLKDNSGKTILMALVFLLVAMMISLVLILGAVNSARVLANDRKSQQACLTVSSAASFIEDILEKSQIAQEGGVNNPYCAKKIVTSSLNGDEVVSSSEVWQSGDGPLAGVILEAVKHADTFHTSQSASFTIDCEGLETVYGEITVSYNTVENETGTTNEYPLVIRLSLGDDAQFNYIMSVTADATLSDEIKNGKKDGQNYREVTTSFKWNSVSIVKGGAA